MMKDMSLQTFISELSSKAPTPGGGGASALGGALGVSLGSMVGNLTLGKKKYADVQEDIQLLLAKLSSITDDLLSLMDRDAEAFLPLSKAYSLPKDTEEQRRYKETVMEEALYTASLVPLEIMEKAYAAIQLEEEIGKKGTRMAISDVAVGVQFLRAALMGASVNIFINTKAMKDRERAEYLNKKTNELIQKGCEKADFIFSSIADLLSKKFEF